MRTVALSVLAQLDVPEQAVDDVTVAVTEACANAVRHAVGSAAYTVALSVAADGCEIEVVDVGPGFDPLGRELADAELGERGRGLFLMRAVVDSVELERVEGRTHVRLRKRWPHVHTAVPGLDDEPAS